MATNNRTGANVNPATELTTDGETGDDQSISAERSGGERDELPLDQVFEILKNERRRTVLRYLDEHDEPVALGDVAEHVAADENDTSVAQISSRERKCAYVGLYQCHLPKMNDMDIVEFNQNRGHIETGPNAAQLKQYLDWSADATRPWPLYYGSTAGTGLVTVLAVGLLLDGAIALSICLAVLLAIAGTAVVHLRTERRNAEPTND